MERLALNTLLEWWQNKRRLPLLISGARQIGKTYLIRELFAKKYFPGKTIYIDFSQNKKYREIFSRIDNVAEINQILQAENNIKLDETSLLIFDEIQECLPALQMLKTYAQDFSHLPVIATGSMVRIKINRNKDENSFLFPLGKINELHMFPMNFEEFLLNTNPSLLAAIKDFYDKKEPLPDELHKFILNELHKFMIIGGLPACVQAYLETQDFLQVKTTLTPLYENYLNDMELYQISRTSIQRTKEVFFNIFKQLDKTNRNFKFNDVEAKTSFRDFASPIDWLTFANIVFKAELVDKHVTYPLTTSKPSLFRIYMMETGFLAYQSNINMGPLLNPSDSNKFLGVFFENYVADEFANQRIPLFYWQGQNGSEFEFLLNSNGSIIPVDVKKNKGALTSLKQYRYENHNDLAIKISSNNYGYDKENKIWTLPLYMTFLLAKDIASGKDMIRWIKS